MKHRRSYWWQVPLLLVLVAASFALALKHQAVQDWWKLRGYTPPAAIQQLASDDTMNAYTRHLFYLNKPKLLSTVTSFRSDCPEDESDIVLGCYHTGENGIFIYAVSDPTLAGVQQVTAAHEVLHAVYARLSSQERTALDTELQAYDKSGLTDSRVKAEIKLYQRTEPGAVYDEMSCTFGTEIAQLPDDLDAYYARYFTDRQKIIGYEQQYQAQFTSRQNQISSYDSQLSTMKQQITAAEASLQAQYAQIQADQARLNGLKNSGQTASYNAGVGPYNSEVDAYNTGVSQLQQQITAYNQLVATRNSVAGQLTTLDQALDTRLTTVK